MSFELFQQPIPVMASILTNTPFYEYPLGGYTVENPQEHYSDTGTDIDSRLHSFLKTFNSTARLRDLLRELKFRQDRNFTPLVFVEQIDSLETAICHLESQIDTYQLRRDEIEYAYICIGEVFQSMAHASPKLKFIKHAYTDNHASLVSLQKSFKELISLNNVLAIRFEILDDSHKKLETKKLKGLLYKTNYFLEYKHAQVYFLLDEVMKKATSRLR